MTNREAYLAELNELAATVVMGWHKEDDAPAWWADNTGQFQYDEYTWQPCQNEAQAWMLVDKVLGVTDKNGMPVLEFEMYHRGPMWDVWFEIPTWLETQGPRAWWAYDVVRSVALTQATILAKGGELPEHKA